jgi:hypothetical protein
MSHTGQKHQNFDLKKKIFSDIFDFIYKRAQLLFFFSFDLNSILCEEQIKKKIDHF